MAEIPGKPINIVGTAEGLPKFIPPAVPDLRQGGGSSEPNANMKLSYDEMVNNINTSRKGADFVPASSIYIGERFASSLPYRDSEEMAAQQQSALDKWGNGFGKLVGTTGTSFLSGTVGTMAGIGNYIASGFKASAFYNNPVNRGLDDINKQMEDALPNYYTQAEKDANWFSGQNLLTANFWSDKVMKNLGYSVGALGAGVAWGSILNAIGTTNRLVQAGKGLETVEGVNSAIATASSTGRFGAISNTLSKLSESYLRPLGAKVASNLDRSIVSVMGTMGEASFEALQSMNDYRDKLINSYVDEYGQRPTGDDLQEINNYAESVGNWTWGMNVALLSASNFIQLPKILNSSKTAERRLMNDVTKKKLDDAATIGEKVEAAYEKMPSLYEKVAGRPGKLFGKYAARPVSLLFSPTEAIEEGGQFAISIGANDYFDRAYQNKEDTSSFFSNLAGVFGNVFTNGINETLSSKEGLESILIGGLAGGMQTSFSPFGMSEVKEKGFFGEGGVRGKNTELAITELNKSKKLNQVLKDAVKYINIGVNSQMLRREAISENDTLSEKDYEKDYALSYILPRVKYGKVDSIKEEINSYRQVAATPEGFNQLKNQDGVVLQNETQPQFIKRLDLIQKSAEDVAKMYDMYNDRYSVIVDKDGKRMFDDGVIEKMTYTSAKIVDYDDRLASLEADLFNKGVSTKTFKDTLVSTEEWKKGDIKGALANPEVEKALKEVGAFIDGKEIDEEKKTLKGEFSDFAEMMLRRKTFIDEFNEMIKSPEKYKEKEITTPEAQIDTETGEPKKVKVKTNRGEVDIKLGVEYFYGRRVEDSEEGFPIFKFPRFTVLEELPDGKLRMRAQDGTIHDVSKNALAKYKVSELSEAMKNKKIKYFIENAGETFLFKRKGGKPPLEGYLEWSDEKNSLEFVYRNSKGEMESFLVTNDQFVAKKGYKEALITKKGPLTPKQEAALTEMSDEKDESPIRNFTSEVITNLYNSSKKRLDEVTASLENKKNKLNEIQEGFDNLTTTKKGEPRKNITKAARKTLNELSSLKKTVEKEIESLEVEKESLEVSIPYFQDLLDNLSEVGDEKLLMEDLKESINSLEEMIDHTNDAISTGKSLIESIDESLKNALSLLSDYAKRLREENPNLPASLEAFQQNIEKFLGEEGAKLFIEQKLGFTQAVIDVEDQIEEFKNELKIPDMTSRIQRLQENLKELQQGLDEFINEQSAKATVLEALEDAAKRYEQQKIEDEKILKNEALHNEVLGTADVGLQTRPYDSSYEPVPRKSDMAVVLSTKTPSASDQPHVKRANLFGIKLPNLKNKSKIRGIVISAKNEAEFGLAGLTQHLKDISELSEEKKAKIDPKKTVVLVMVVETKSGSYVPVDVDGNVIETPSFENAIYQTFPDPSLEWSEEYGGGSMFRKETVDDKSRLDYYKKQYAEWHNEMLEFPTNLPHNIEASFGKPQIPTRLDESGKAIVLYDTRTSALDAGLITEADLRKAPLVKIPTTSGVLSKGSTFFDSPLGRPFLSLANAYVKLMNRKLTKNEASTIYEAIYHLSKDIAANGNAKSEKSKRLINWLRSIIYWGTPKNATGYNSVFFDKTEDGFKIFFSGKGKNYAFTPQTLLDNREEIISILEGMYNNINSGLADKKELWNEPYEEIIGFDKDGEPIVREVGDNPYWPNYQTYLLSGKGRKPEEIPLATQMRPLTDENDVNRDGVYFTLTDTADSSRYNNPPKAVSVLTPISAAPAAPTAAPTPTPTAEKKFEEEVEFDGKKENTVEFKDLGVATFKLDIKKFVETDGEEGFSPMFDKAMVDKVKELKKKETDDEAKNIIASGILSKIKDKIEKYKKEKAEAQVAPKEEEVKEEEKPKEEEEEVAPTFDLGGEKENMLDLKLGDTTTISVMFKFNGKQFIATNGNEGFTPIFDKDTINTVIKFFKDVKNKVITEDYAKDLIGDAIIKRVTPSVDKLREQVVPSITPSPTPSFTPSVPVSTDAAESPTPSPVVETPPAAEPSRAIVPSAAEMRLIREQMKKISGRTPLRKKIEQDIKKFKPENWNSVEKWLKANFPNIPVYRVKNIIQTTNGGQAWGMFKDGAIYIYENAEVGTAYHEVFHAVWRMFSDPTEQASVIAEVRARKGMEDASEEQIEELLAEEFRDYVQFKKIPGRPSSGKPYVLRMFADLFTFIKEFFTGKKANSNTRALFEKIGSGYYVKYNPYQASLAFAKKGIIDIEEAYASSDSAFRIKDIPANYVHAIMEQMTYTTLTDLVANNKSLFNVPKLNKKKLYERLLQDMQETALLSAKSAESLVEEGVRTQAEVQIFVDSSLALWKKITDNWEELKKKHEEHLKTYDVEFDENDNSQLTSDERAKESGWQDATKIDIFRKTNTAVKLLLSTIPIVDNNGKFVPSDINGARLLPTSQVFMSLMNNLHTSRTIDEMMERLREMANNDPNYRTLYERLTNTSYTSDTLDLSTISEIHDGQLLSAFWRTFKKQNPDVKNVYIFENGDVEVGDSNFSTAARQVASEYVESFKNVLNSSNPYFVYSKEKKAYIGKPDGIKNIKEGLKKSGNEGEVLDKMVAFLKSIGIEFKKEDVIKLRRDRKDTFKDAVNGIIKSIEDAENIATISGKVLKFQGRFMALSTIQAMIDNPEFDSTFFNVKGERVQSFIGTNAPSDLFDVLSQIENKQQLVGTPYEYLITDEFAQNSVIIDKMFDKETGDRIEGSEQLMKPGYVDGTIDTVKGKKKQSSKLNYKERLIQEINMNLKGFYYNLVPGDASIEWMLYMTNHVTPDSLLSGFARVNELFKGYFLSELALAKSNRSIVELKGRKETDLRFLKPILGEELHNQIIKETGTPEEVYRNYKSKINTALEKFITSDAESVKRVMFEYGIITIEEGNYKIDNIAFKEKEGLNEAALNRQLNALSINYMINNIELHKIMYSDPYQYKDELKRIKNFNSPRQAIINGSEKMNAAFNNIWNKARSQNDIGRTNFIRDFFRTATIEDVLSTSDLKDYGIFEETDGGGSVIFKAYRNFRIRAGEWNDDEEMQFNYDIAYEKVVKGKGLSEEEKAKRGLLLTPEESKFLTKEGDIDTKKNPQVKSAYTPIKPIVSGNKANGKSYNDVLLDKFALYPMSFRIAHEMNPNSNAVKQYDKMQREDIDYIVFATGRKVGAEKLNPIYNETDGSFNETAYEGLINVPFNIISIQSEVPSKDTPLITRGSQVTKLVTLDYMEAGVPIDFEIKDKKGNVIKDFDKRFKEWNKLKTEEAKEIASPLYKEIKNNQSLLIESIKEAYSQLLNEMGIKETVGKDGKKSFKIDNFEKAAQTLRSEILKREVNDNINDALTGFLNGEAILEATPAYQQVRNILYSIADKRVISPKISGGQKVQIASTFFEENRLKAEGKEGNVFSAAEDVLAFYKNDDGKRVCEIMVGRWFKSNMSDEALLKYLNDTPEGQKILKGVAFRIPTQKQNSIDVFKIKKFVPKEFGDSVVIPSALVKKVGSDFDIDKLSIYFKNIYKDVSGKIKMVELKGSKEDTKYYYGKVFDEILEKSQLQKNELLNAIDIFVNDRPDVENLVDKYEFVINALLDKDAAEDVMFRLEEKLAKLNDAAFQKTLREQYVNKMYKQALENAYVQSMENLISHPLNFARLTAPNSADQLKNLAKKITKKLGFESFDYSSTTNMLSRRFMSRMRHAFVTGKYAIGIAAVSQTNHSLNQRQPTYIDIDRFDNLSDVDKFWLTTGTGNREDLNVKFSKFNRIEVNGRMVPTLSMIRNAEKSKVYPNGQDISDINGQFIDGYVDISKGPWIMELGATPNVASTWLFLAKIGVPIETVAYFMNQPIVREYLRSIEADGYSYLFMKDYVERAKDNYKTSSVISKNELPSDGEMFEMVGNKDLNEVQKAQQQFILDEFLKYAKMAEQLFNVTQGSNFDTSTFNDPYLVFKKIMQLTKAQKSIISSVDDILENSFIGTLKDTILDIRESFSELLKSEHPNVRTVVETVLMDYIDLPDSEFVETARKVVNNLFDWAVQIDREFNLQLQNILLSENNAAKEISDFVTSIAKDDQNDLSRNLVIKSLIPRFADSKDSSKPNNLKIKNKDNKVYDQNQMIYAFQELKTYLKGENSNLYDKLLKLAVLQSGLSNSPISFTSLIPYDDFKEMYNKTLSTLESFPNLASFAKLNVFQRNNWSDDDIVPYKKGKEKFNPIFFSRYYSELSFGSKENLTKDMKSGKIPQVIKIYAMSSQSKSDMMVYSWEVGSPKEKREMRAKGDFSFIRKGLFKKVYRGEGKEDPLIYNDKRGNPQYIYKMVNAWGDSFRANEFYDHARKSVIDNGFLQVENEVDDSTIVTYFDTGAAPLKATVLTPTVSFEKAFSSERQKEILKNFTAKHKVTEEAALDNIKKGIATEGQKAIDKLNECY